MSLEDFEYGRVLGKGVFGSVLIVKRKEDKEIYAMKRVKIGGLTKKELENSFNEVRLLASLNHKNVIGYREAFYDQKSKTLNIVMEYADDGDLSTKIKLAKKKQAFFEEAKIWSTLIQILEGLKYLHRSDIIHRDLKSANIFLTKKGLVKIGDLNVSKIIGKNMAITQTGTPYYASPEIWNDHPYDYKCDIWSTGCIIYEMASLKMPFRGTSMQMLYNNVMKGDFDPIPSRYSKDLMEIIKLILIKNPRQRPSAEDLLKNRIILQKMEKLGMEKSFWIPEDEKAMLMKTIKLPGNLNQMSQVNRQLPRKNYKKDRLKNRMEMLENDEYETAKNSFYHSKDTHKMIKKEKSLNHLNNLNTIKDIYNEPKYLGPLIEKKYMHNESNITDMSSNNNGQMNNKYSYHYSKHYNYNNNCTLNNNNNNNRHLSNIKNNNYSKKLLIPNNNKIIGSLLPLNYNKEKEPLNKINNHHTINKKEDIYSKIRMISENKKIHIKNQNIESLRVSTSGIYTSEGDKICKNPTSINEPIKLLQNRNLRNSINIFSKKEEKKSYLPINSIQNGCSGINNIFESQIQKILNKKSNQINSISSIQSQSRYTQNKYMPNPSVDNILKNKKVKIQSIESQKKKINKNKSSNKIYNKFNSKINNKNTNKSNNIYNTKKLVKKEMIRNRSFKGIICYNPLYEEEKDSEVKIIKKPCKVRTNFVRRNISTEFLTRKNSSIKYKDNVYNKNNSHIIDSKNNNKNINKENLSNDTRVRRIKKQLEDIIPSYEFEKIFKRRLASANINNNRKKNNVNVKININNNYNYINSLNINNNNNNRNHNFNTDNQYPLISKNSNLNSKNYKYHNNKSVRPRSTSSNICKEKYKDKSPYKNPSTINKLGSIQPKIRKNNNFRNITTTDNNNIIGSNIKESNLNKRYKDFYDLYYQNFLRNKMQNHIGSKKAINFNQNNGIQNNNRRKIIYEKINVVQKQGEERKYIKGASVVRSVGEGNFNNQCHREIIKYQNFLKYNNNNNNDDYSIQNFISKDFKDNKIGPRIILPKKMIMES